jgi:hypothetical protein
MAQMNKIQSFKTFSEVKMQEKQQQIQEEQEAKRNETAAKIAETLAEMEVTSLTELSEEQRKQLVAKLFNEDAAEDIEDKINNMGEPAKADEEGDELEAEMTEGNAFIYAAAKAKAEGKKEFEFNGKSYKVTLKKDTGLKESVQLLITEGTRSQVGKIDKNGNITSVYVHWDGYPDNMLPKVKKYDAKGVDELIKLGKAGISSLEDQIGKKHDFNNPTRGWTIFYGRDRGETGNMISKGNAKNVRSYLKDVGNEAGAEYVYLYDERDGKWYMADVYSDKELKLTEGLITEATRWQFGIIDKSGKIQSNYVHYDGYPSAVVPEIKKMNAAKVKKMLKDSEMGGMSSLGDFYNDSQKSTIITGEVKNIKKYLQEAGDEAGAEYVYLYDERIGKWVGADVYTDKALKPVEQLSESMVTEGVKLNGESDAGKARLAEKEFGHLLPADFKFADVTTSGGRKRLAIKYKGKPAFEFSTGLDKGIAKTKRLDKAWVESGINYIKKYVAESQVTEGKSFSESEIKATAEIVATAVAKVEGTKTKVINFETLDKNGKIAGFYIHKDNNTKGAPSRYWVTDSGEVVSAFRHDTFGDGVIAHVGDKLASVVKTFKANESVVNEAEVSSDSEFEEYAMAVLKKAFGKDFDEAKAKEVVDGLKSKYSGDYGAMVGALQSSLGESVVIEKNADGTISDDEDDDMDNLRADVRFMTTELINHIKTETERIGGSFRSPGYEAEAKKIIKDVMQKNKFRL